MKRREFLVGCTLAATFPKQKGAIEVEVMEVFSSANGPSALLVHHADEATRETFATWLRRNSGKRIVCGRPGKTPIAAWIHRVSLCFGRGLILLREPPSGLRAKEVMSIITDE